MKIKEQVDKIFNELKSIANDEKREILSRFFKTNEGEYGAGDQFLGIPVPKIRTIASAHKDIDLNVIAQLLASEWHEMRTCALVILTGQAEVLDRRIVKNDTEAVVLRNTLVEFYLSHTDRINNWDLVDLSAPTVIGKYLIDKPRNILYKLAESKLLWDNRIAMVSTLGLIRAGQTEDTYLLALKLMHHPHDLMQKAVGWMLREAGKQDMRRLYLFVDDHRLEMPRTMLRYAIEKFDAESRRELMQKPD